MVEKTKITCPICGKNNVPALFYPSTIQIRSARGSGQSGKVTFRTKEKYEVLGNCPDCGQKKKTIQKVLDGKLSVESAKSGKTKKCRFCGEHFSGSGSLCPQCAEWED